MGVLGLIFSAILCFELIWLKGSSAEPYEDKQALLDFVLNTPHSRYINWNQEYPVCNSWAGVTCNNDQTRVLALRLPGVGFSGSIPPNTLGRLSALQILSLRSNLISGPFPSDLLKLGNLTSLQLQFNRISGPLPSNFSAWENMSLLNLSNNHFNGSIPYSINNLTHLTSLDLSKNLLSGGVPGLHLPSLKYLNLSNNNLHGLVPRSLQMFPSSTFSGNNVSSEISSPPPPPMMPPTGQTQHRRHKRRLGETAMIGILLGGCCLVFAAIAFYTLVICSNRARAGDSTAKSKKKAKPSKKPEGHGESSRITFFEGSNRAFDLEDLLRASAEVLGKGMFGTTYKAALEDSMIVVVKRLKEVRVGKKDFEQQMEAVGRIRHENVAALRAYYYSKDEKLMVYDYFSVGSVSTLLHGRTENKTPLDWETRLRVSIGAARGLAYIHTENNGKAVHGNIKSSNIFLNTQQFGCISDMGLATIVTPLAPPVTRSAGYRAPELTDPQKATQASDVYSFGVFLLELLTGKSPLGDGMNLVKWVNSVVREEWTAEVFDVELLRHPNVEEEMVQMLQLGMTCSVRMPEQRPKMWEVVRMMEEIGRSGGSTPNSSSHVVEIGSTSAPQ